MIFSLVHEIQKWIAEHQGAKPSAIRVSQAVLDECVEEGKRMGMTKDKRRPVRGVFIQGIPVIVDPTLTIGQIDP